MASRSLIQRWVGEYCAPVVVTVTTAEAEAISLKNGLLFHELLSAFGHLDGMNCTIKSGSQSFVLPDAHIRFERATELQAKNSDMIEKLMGDAFQVS